MSTEVKIWFSAAEIAQLGNALIGGLPKSIRGALGRAKANAWESRIVPGRGGKGGLKTEYKLPQEVMNVLTMFLKENPNFFTKDKAEVKDISNSKPYPPSKAPSIVSGSGDHAGLLLEDRPAMDSRHFNTDFVLVPKYDVHASAGHGAVVHSEQIVDYLAFKKAWIRSTLDCGEKDLALITVKGDSMEPTLSNDDLILVNLRKNQIIDNAVYVLQYDGSLLVKRIQRLMSGSVIVKGDNPEYRAEELSADQADLLRVFGMVVWYGRKM